jgi:hypothetical protein
MGEGMGFIVDKDLRRLIQKINRQVSTLLSVIEPPTSGPIADPMLYMPRTIGDSIACFFKDTQYDRIVVVPLTKPAAPRPEIARPMISVIEFGATAETMEPISKTASEMQYTHLIL